MPTQSGTYATPRLDLGAALMEMGLPRRNFVSNAVLSPFSTPKKTGIFSAITRAGIGRQRTVRRTSKSAFNRDTFEAKDISYTCKEYGHEQQVGDEERAMYMSDFDAEVAAAQIAEDIIRADRERRFVTLLTDLAVWTGTQFNDHSSGGDNKPWATAGTDIRAQIISAAEVIRKATGGLRANTLVVSASQRPNLAANTAINSAIQYTNLPTMGAITQALAGYFDVDQVLLAGAVDNTANEGQAFSGSDMWPTSYAWLGVSAPNGAPLTYPCIGRALMWSEMQGASDVLVTQYREEQTRSDIIRAEEFRAEKVFDTVYGVLIKVG